MPLVTPPGNTIPIQPDIRDIPADLLREISIDNIRGHIAALEGTRHRAAAPEALERAACYIARHLEDLGFAVSSQPFAYDGTPFRNIIGTIPGTGKPDEHLLLIAHYDTVAGTPGADDNASGVAVMLEAARVLAGVRLERTLHIAGVSLEENQREGEQDSWTVGSRVLAEYAATHGWQVEGVIVLESVGYAGADAAQTLPPGVPIPAPPAGDFIALVGNEHSGGLLELFGRHCGRLPHLALAVPGNGEMLPDTRRSDHAPFWDRGYRAIMVTDTTNFRNPHYHRATDTLDTLDLEFAAQVCRASVGTVLELGRPAGSES